MHALSLSLLMLYAAGAPPVAQQARPTYAPQLSTSTEPPRQAVIAHCLVSLVEDIQVPALEAGALMAVEAAEGQYVQAGQVLARIDDRQSQLQRIAAELERDAAIAKANDDIEVRYAQAALAVANADVERALAVDRKSSGAITPQEIQKLRLAKQRDELQIDRSKLDMKVAKMTADVHQATVDAAAENVLRRQIISPIDGMVVTLLHERGEWVAAGEPVVQVVRTDRMRVEGFLSALEFNAEEVAGKPVMVEVTLARDRKVQFVGRVVFISPLVQAGNKYRVRAEVENRIENGYPLLRPGMTATMSISLQ
ncbi:Multidrug resistance efflux pump-like protein [Pirellula staleyi DSM 6068]|uniref:Multidrug resistance efflux pump-like protein n=1 Tax=Pirellula staleyi (strain ATCC 27377 / DSM 6068 / ICPB 4128) TaxID=530564 RepID=D2R2L6_PIRSD|nr:HlyD family efflux transporter periplasmic adaptor subunit [Pirellula staleyi]ADB16856.1 Multidrug resistance efflux pump-like protein [Pirellula staleyi DSM 6068]